MAEWAFTIATNEYVCPRCGAEKGQHCRTPSGRRTNHPHGERVHQLTEADVKRCTGTVVPLHQALDQFVSILSNRQSVPPDPIE